MKSALRASVVIPTYNRVGGVRRLLEQLARQTLAPDRFEVVVVDDGSATDVRSELTPSDYPFPLQIARQPNAGPAAARQLGAGLTSGEVLVFVDDDVELPQQFLAAHLAEHSREDGLVLIGRLRGEGTARGLPLVERYRLGIGDRFSAAVRAERLELGGLDVYSGNLSLPRALFDEIGGFDCSLRQLEDVDLGLRLAEAGARFALSDAGAACQSEDPMSTRDWFARSLSDGSSRVEVSRKHPGLRSASPWHLMGRVNPASRPLLTLSALAPTPAAALAHTAFATASAADALGFERVAIAGATFVYGVNLFRGVGRGSGGGRATLREYREFRRGVQGLTAGRRGGDAQLHSLREAIEQDYRVLVHNRERYGPRRADSPAAAFVSNIGFQLVVSYRVMRYLRALELPLATRALARGMRHAFGSDVHWNAQLEPGLMVVHGFGLAISAEVRTAHGCVLSQNVTLGTGRDPDTGAIGAPSLREDVSVGPGSTLTGPIVIGGGSKIGPGCTLRTSVPARSIVEAPAPVIRPR